MDEVDPLTKGRLRDWQARRLAIKDQMQASPERTLELSRVLDLMDEEHEQILHAARSIGVINDPEGEADSAPSSPLGLVEAVACQASGHGIDRTTSNPVRQQCELRLSLSAKSVGDLRKLLALAIHELDGKLEQDDSVMGRPGDHAGHMSGTLGEYRFELDVKDEADE
ncbi:hypothetical protein G7009_03890 [Pseudomonas capeferrum]|uniref:hypothetical protein n=1 Tax=Pseudomonas capeferrum TaxID=1495066 RepID=UPI0015E38972|nr:hypothetical protein [Pseudomonas capeferrum]MBA1200923.1 hypothetical protein [Pseudomonas capeferrum]